MEFHKPVDWKALNILDYPLIVKNPMDLQTASTKLQINKYKFVQEVLDDLQLIWDNCKIYNPKDSWIHNYAQQLERQFKRMVKNYLPNIPIIVPGSKNRERLIFGVGVDVVKIRYILTLPYNPSFKLNIFKITHFNPLGQNQPGRQTQRKPANGVLIQQDEPHPFNYHTKLKFAEKLKHLSPQQLGSIVEVVLKLCPQAFKDHSAQDADLLVDQMDADTFTTVLQQLFQNYREEWPIKWYVTIMKRRKGSLSDGSLIA